MGIYEEIFMNECHKSMLRIVQKMIDRNNTLIDKKGKDIDKQILDQQVFLQNFVDHWETEFQTVLNQWIADGTFENLFNETALGKKLDKSTFEQTVLSLNQQLAETVEVKVGGGVKAEPEDLSSTTLGLVTGTGGPINLLTVPQNESVTSEKLGSALRDSLTFNLENIVSNGNFSDGVVGWTVSGGATAISASGGVLTGAANGSNANAHFIQDFPSQAGRFYVKLRFRVRNEEATAVSILVGNQEIRYNRGQYEVNQWQEVSVIVNDPIVNRISFIHRFPTAASSAGQTLEVADIVIINLTESNYEKASVEELQSLLSDFTGQYIEGKVNLFNARKLIQQKVAEKNKVYNMSWLKDHGAIGDGITDDSFAIQKALDIGGIILVNPGTYRMSKTHTIKSNTTIIGFGEATKFILGDNFNLTPTKWRATDATLPDYHPYFISELNSMNIELENFVIEGNKIQFVDHIQVGLASETTKNMRVKNVRISNVNYFPSQAPPRPAGQFRTGWNFAAFRSSDIVVDGGLFEYGGYECFRVGDDCDGVTIKNATLRYGWRTVFQVLRGSKNVLMKNCKVIQNDFGTNDSHAAITVHASALGFPIENFTIEDSKIDATLFTDNPNGGSAFACVGDYFNNINFKNTSITSNGVGIGARTIGDFKMRGVKVDAQQIGVNLTVLNANNVDIKECEIKSLGGFALNIIGTKVDSLTVTDSALTSASGIGIRSAFTSGGKILYNDNNINSKGLGVQFDAGELDTLEMDRNEVEAAENHCFYISALTINKRLSIKDNAFSPGVSNDGVFSSASNVLKNVYIDRNVTLTGKYGVQLMGTLTSVFVTENIASGTTHGFSLPEDVVSRDNITQ